jgi:hypothetical protein
MTVNFQYIQELVESLSPIRANSFSDWLGIGECLQNIDDRLLYLWKNFTRQSEKYGPVDCEKRWKDLNHDNLEFFTLEDLIVWSKEDNKHNKHNTETKKDKIISTSQDNYKKYLQWMLEYNKTDDKYDIPLFDACKDGKLKYVKILLEHGADVDQKDENGTFPLLVTCKYSIDTKIVALLLEHDADVSQKRNDGSSLLYIACKYSTVEIVKMILDRMIFNVKELDELLYFACQHSKIDIARILVNYGARGGWSDNYFFRTCSLLLEKEVKDTRTLQLDKHFPKVLVTMMGAYLN